VAVIVVSAPAGAVEPAPPVQIDAILSLTGAGAFLGQDELRTLDVIAGLVNARGGVHGHRVIFHVLDDQSSPQIAVQLAGTLIAKNAPMLLGPTIPQTCAAVLPLIEKSGPVMFCLNPAIHPVAGSYGFSSGEDSKDGAIVVLRYLHGKGITRVATLMATDGSGQDMDRSLEYAFALPEFAGMQLVAKEHFAPTDIGVSAQLARIKTSAPQALLSWCAGTPLGTVLRGANEAGFNLPIVTTGGNMNRVQMEQYAGFLPKDMLFTSQIAWIPGTVGPGPIRDAQRFYTTAITRAGYRPDAGYTLVWDPALLYIAALEKLGVAADASAIRSFITKTRGWIGIDGVYDFVGFPQRGLDASSGQVSAWNAAKRDFVAVSKRAGYVR
jgi:branched-chain amino acid transport system substrate-binding protein